MTKMLVLAVAAVLLSTPSVGAAPELPAPSGTVTVTVGGSELTLWPYTFEKGPTIASDPINLVFPNSDPRGIRQALIALDGTRSPYFPPVAPFDCRWTDAMGNEQAAWAETEGWVGGEVQLACTGEGAPLGNPFRFHLRLFRQGTLTLGAAHLDFLIPGTAEHEGLSWDVPRSLVMVDMMRAGVLTALPGAVSVIPAGTFREVRRPIYDALLGGGAAGLLAALGLPTDPDDLPPAGEPVPIPTDGAAAVLASNVTPAFVEAKTRTAFDVTYNVVTPRPFCSSGPADFVSLQGTLHFDMRVHTNPSGLYLRDYVLSGTLTATPLMPSGGTLVPSGPPAPVDVYELHRAQLTDNYGQVEWQLSQKQVAEPLQSLTIDLSAGQVDRFATATSCGTP